MRAPCSIPHCDSRSPHDAGQAAQERASNGAAEELAVEEQPVQSRLGEGSQEARARPDRGTPQPVAGSDRMFADS